MESWLKAGDKAEGDLAGYIGERLRRAYEIASKNGVVVGHVSRVQEAGVDGKSPIVIDVDPRTYYSLRDSAIHRLGDYLVVVDPKSLKLILLRVTRIIRRDELAGLGVDPSLSAFSGAPDPRSLLTVARVEGEPVVEAGIDSLEEPVPASSSIEPQSPVIDPSPSLLSKLLSVPGEGVLLGALSTFSGPVKDYSIRVALPYNALLQHVLIVGTTGSGKTTLMKNMVASMYSGEDVRAVAVIVDMNQDFVQLPLPPDEATLRDPVYTGVFRGVKPPPAIVSVFPLPGMVVRSVVGSGENVRGLDDVVRAIASEYARETYAPLLGAPVPGGATLVKRHGVVGGHVNLGFSLIAVPYAINTMSMESDRMSTLLPGLSSLARDLLRLLRERFRRENGFYPPIQAIHAAVRHYIRESRAKVSIDLAETVSVHAPSYVIARDPEMSVRAFTTFQVGDTGTSMLGMTEKLLEEIEKAMPHRDTIEALYRRLNALLESEVVDIAITMDSSTKVTLLGEPKWEDIVRLSLEESAPIVLDLRWPMDKGLGSLEGPRLVVYRMLESLVSWKMRAWISRERTPKVIVMIDEAHQFFPQEGHSREEQEANRQVASLISRIARLGRARGLGLVFSTHSPRDLHDIILQLANTKIVLRTERQHAERLDLPGEITKFLANLPDRVMVVMSHVVRGGFLVARTSPPVTAHFDASKDLSRG